MIDTCPRCGKAVAWLKYDGIYYCQQCRNSLWMKDLHEQCERGRMAEAIADSVVRKLKEEK